MDKEADGIVFDRTVTPPRMLIAIGDFLIDSQRFPIDFMLSAKRDARAAKRFFRKMLKAASHSFPRVISVDKNPAYPPAIEQLKEEGTLPNRAQLRQCKYLNNIIEQDHRFMCAA